MDNEILALKNVVDYIKKESQKIIFATEVHMLTDEDIARLSILSDITQIINDSL